MKQTIRQGRAIVLLVAALTLCGAMTVSAGLYDTWGYTAQIQFTGYNKSETLTNFPALVVLSNNCFSGFSYSQFKSGSNDLAFTADAAGTMNLNYEIDTWNSNGASYVWVQVPALTTNSAITAWWGGVTNSVPVCTTNGSVWGSQYYGVWHLGQASGNLLDSTTNVNTGLPESSPVQGTNGLTGGAVWLNGSSSYVATTVSANNNPQVFTESIWFKTTAAQGRLMGLGNAQTGQSGSYDRMIYLSSAGQVYFGIWNGGSVATVNTAGSYANGAWHVATGIYSMPGFGVALYMDGVPIATNTSTGTAASEGATGYWRIGYDNVSGWPNASSAYVQGTLDEARVSKVMRSANWVWAEYLNMASNGVFNSYGAAIQTNPNLPQITDIGSQNLLSTSANVVGTLMTNGAAGTATVYLYWSTTDGMTNASSWTTGSGSNLGSFADGTTFTNTLTGLSSGTTYYWNYSAVNASGTVWGAIAGSPSFKTLAAPVVTNSAATSVGEFSATLNGNLTGGGSAHVYILQGLQDGVWSVTNDVGTRTEGAFSFPVSGLTLATKYYYTAYATNIYGAALATPPTNFTTLAASTYTFNANNANWTAAANWTGGSYPPPRNGDIGIVSNIIALANGNLYSVGVETPPAQIWVRTNGSLQIANSVGLAEHNLILDGGTLSEQAYGGTATNNGSIRVNRNSTIGINNNDTLKLNGLIQDNGANSGQLQLGLCGGSSSTIYLNGTNNTWTGGATVGGGSGSAPVVYAGAPGCLGTGPIMVTNGLLVTATAKPADTAHIGSIAVTNVFGCTTVTVCGASATYLKNNNGELEVMGDSPNATYLLNSGGILAMHTNLVGGTLILNGGIFGATDYSGGFNYDYWNVNPTFYGPIRVRGNSYLGNSGNEVVTLSSPIQNDGANTGTLITQLPGYYQQTIKLYTTNSTWTGGFLAQGQLVYAAASNCLGTGAVVINNASTYSGGGTAREWFQLSVPYAGLNVASFTVQTNGYLIVCDSNVVGNQSIVLTPGATARYMGTPADLSTWSFGGNNLMSYQGIVREDHDNAAGLTVLDTITVNTSVTFMARSSLGSGGKFNINGLIRDGTTAGQVIKGVSVSAANDWVKLGCATNSYSGGTDVNRGPMEVLAAGALSTGNVNVNSGGRLKTSAANSLGSVTSAGHTVSVNANGSLELNATETNPYTVQAGGALMADAAGLSSTFTYGTGGNIQLQKGAILDTSVAAKPSYAAVSGQLLSGDGRFGLYEGHNGGVGTYTATRFFGDDSNTNIWRGLGLLNGGSTMTCTNTMAANPGTAYLDFYAQRDAAFTFQNASLLANTVLINGQGTFVFQNGSGTSTYNNIYYNGGSLGIGGLKIVSNGDVRAGATVNISNGWFTVSYTDSLANLTVNLNSGAVFNITTNLTSGTINLNQGSATYVDRLLRMSNGANWIVYAGSQIGLGVGRNGGNTPIYDLPTNGLADFVGWCDYIGSGGGLVNAFPLYLNKGLVLGDNTRFTSGPYNDGFYTVLPLSVKDSDGGGDAFRLAPGSTQCRLCSPGGTTNTVTLPVTLNAGAGKLIVGDANLFNALLVGGVSGYSPITQNGTVYLTSTNQIGDVDVRAGMLRVDGLTGLGTSAATGGSRTIATSNAATMWLNFSNPVLSNTTLRGSGMLVLSTPTDTLTLTNAAGTNCTIQPGLAGPLSVQGNLTFATNATPTPFTVNIGKVGGVVTNGLLAVSGSVTGLTNASLYVSFDPTVRAADVSGKVFTILTCANDLTAAPHFKSVTWAAPATKGTVTYTAGAVRLTTITIPAAGTTLLFR